MEKILKGDSETAALAHLMSGQVHPGDIIALKGPLGAGKSTFARAFIQSLCGSETVVPSPTFTLVQPYDTPRGPLYHYDLYRLNRTQDLLELGFEEHLQTGICLIEWPELAKPLLPVKTTLHIEITPLAGHSTQRAIHLSSTAPYWQEILARITP